MVHLTYLQCIYSLPPSGTLGHEDKNRYMNECFIVFLIVVQVLYLML